MKTELLVVRVPKSHRRNDRIRSALGFRPQSYYNLMTASQFIYLTPEDFEKAKPHGATLPRRVPKLNRCWSMGPIPGMKDHSPNQPYETP